MYECFLHEAIYIVDKVKKPRGFMIIPRGFCYWHICIISCSILPLYLMQSSFLRQLG